MAFSKLDWQETILRGAGKDLSHAEMRILMTMSTYADSRSGGSIHPGKKRIADDTGCSRTTVDDAIRKFIERGYLRLTQQGGNQVRRGYANVYKLTYPKWVLGNDTRTPATGHEESESSPQGDSPLDEGPHSLDTRPPVSGHEAPQPLGSHPVIDPVIYPVNMGALNSPSLSDASRNLPVNLSEPARAELVEAIQSLADALITDCPPEEYEEAEEHLHSAIALHLGDEAQDLWVHEWKVAGPQTTPAGAEKKLNHFIGHMVKTGYPITAMEGAA